MTELMWEGKYDKDGKRVALLRVALPFQTVEKVNESAAHTYDPLGEYTIVVKVIDILGNDTTKTMKVKV